MSLNWSFNCLKVSFLMFSWFITDVIVVEVYGANQCWWFNGVVTVWSTDWQWRQVSNMQEFFFCEISMYKQLLLLLLFVFIHLIFFEGGGSSWEIGFWYLIFIWWQVLEIFKNRYGDLENTLLRFDSNRSRRRGLFFIV